MFLLVLLPAEADPFSKERYSKNNPVSAFSSNGGKIILTLLVGVDKIIRIDLSTEGHVSPYIHEGLG